MSTVPIPASDDENRLANLVSGSFDVPAYVRRARRVEDAVTVLTARCRRERDEWLKVTRIYLGTLQAQAGTWAALRPLLADDDQVAVLEVLAAEIRPRLRFPPPPTDSRRVWRRMLKVLIASLERVNHRWREYLPAVDLSPVNDARDGYNRYYVLEKECATRSPQLARLGFQPLPPFTREEFVALLPELPVPRLA